MNRVPKPKTSAVSLENRKIQSRSVNTRSQRCEWHEKLHESFIVKVTKPVFPCSKLTINQTFAWKRQLYSKEFPKSRDVSSQKSLLQYKRLIRSIDSSKSFDLRQWSNQIYEIERTQRLSPLKISSQSRMRSHHSSLIRGL